MDLLDRHDLDTYLARLLLREGRLTQDALQALLGAARATRGQGGPTLARTLVDRKLIAQDELGAILARGVEETRGGPVGAGPTPAHRRLGDYELLEELGAGGMGRVFRARHVETGGLYALKTLSAADADALLRFQREGLGQARVAGHPGIVHVHAFDVAGGVHFLVMDLVTGGTLADRLKESLPPPEVAACWVRDLAIAVEHAHRHGVLHRDLKPANVLFSDGRPVLVDFGLAKLADLRSMTETGTLLGTPSYMAPEQIERARGDADERTDVYGLGGLLHYALTGSPPFGGGTLWMILAQVLEERPPSPRDLRPEVPPALAQVCRRALEKDPHRRYPSAQALADAIDAALEAEPSRTPWVLGAVAGGIALVGIGVAVSIEPGPPPAPPVRSQSPLASPVAAGTPAPRRTFRDGSFPAKFRHRPETPAPQAADRGMLQSLLKERRDRDALHRLLALLSVKRDTRFSARFMRELGLVYGNIKSDLCDPKASRGAMVHAALMGDGEAALFIASHHVPVLDRSLGYVIESWKRDPAYVKEDAEIAAACLSLARHFAVKENAIGATTALIRRLNLDPPRPRTALKTIRRRLGRQRIELAAAKAPPGPHRMWSVKGDPEVLKLLHEHRTKHRPVGSSEALDKLERMLPSAQHGEIYRDLAWLAPPTSIDRRAYLARATLIGDARAAMILARAAGATFDQPRDVRRWTVKLKRDPKLGTALLVLAAHHGGTQVRARVWKALALEAKLEGGPAAAYRFVWKRFPEGR